MELKMEMKDSIERALGRKVLADEKGNVDSFAGFSDLDKEEFRTLQETNLTMEISYIRYRLKHDAHLSDVISYASSVIHQGMDVEKWERSHLRSNGESLPRIPADQLDDGDDDSMELHGKPFTGVAYEIYPNGQLWEEITYLNGYRNGLCRWWHRNGQLKKEFIALPGGPADRITVWHENGALKSISEHELGIETRHREWDEKGPPIDERKIEPNGEDWRRILERRERRNKEG